MDWKQLLENEIRYTYNVTDQLLNMVDENRLNWKPSGGTNWLTVGQLLCHITDACGAPIRGFVTGDWGFDIKDISADEMLPLAEKFPSVKSVAEARDLLEKDKILALEMLSECDEESLNTRITKAPWDSTDMILGQRILEMISHLTHHKVQLFYYLKLQGKDVNTSHLWGTRDL